MKADPKELLRSSGVVKASPSAAKEWFAVQHDRIVLWSTLLMLVLLADLLCQGPIFNYAEAWAMARMEGGR